MYREVSKLIMYGNMDKESILMKMADIFRKFDNKEEADEVLIQEIYTQIKRILIVAYLLQLTMALTKIYGTIILHLFLSQMKIHLA